MPAALLDLSRRDGERWESSQTLTLRFYYWFTLLQFPKHTFFPKKLLVFVSLFCSLEGKQKTRLTKTNNFSWKKSVCFGNCSTALGVSGQCGGVEEGGEGLQSHLIPCPNHAGRKKPFFFFQSQPPKWSTVTCFWSQEWDTVRLTSIYHLVPEN
jgi:hypothetical protein